MAKGKFWKKLGKGLKKVGGGILKIASPILGAVPIAGGILSKAADAGASALGGISPKPNPALGGLTVAQPVQLGGIGKILNDKLSQIGEMPRTTPPPATAKPAGGDLVKWGGLALAAKILLS